MQQITAPFSLRYEGNDADEHTMDALQFGRSLAGAARIYNVTAHYCLFGEVPRGNYKKELTSYVSVPKEGSYEACVVITTLTQQNLMYTELGKAALTQVLFAVIGALKRLWITNKPEDTVTALNRTLTEIALASPEANKLLTNGLIKANDDLASLQGKLIETLPVLASSLRPSAKKMVTPIGNSCKSMCQFHGTSFATAITEPEADVIREGDHLEIEGIDNFECERILEINLSTGHCEMLVEGVEGVVKGIISDPILNTPGNVYTQALDQRTPFDFSAKPVKKDGKIHRLYISDAKEES